ncbi:hypothetical protein VP01_576g8, partial [Puccinia sorghi]
YSLIDKLNIVTADNTLVNSNMAHELDLQIPHFESLTQILGCVAHVINLAAKIGISALGSSGNSKEVQEVSMAAKNQETTDSTSYPMNIDSLVSPPDGATLNLEIIYKHVHGLRTWVRFSPQ